MEKQLTAIEWLEYQLSEGTMPVKKAFNQAKAMEKEQISTAFGEGIFSVNKTGKQYYNETFK